MKKVNFLIFLCAIIGIVQCDGDFETQSADTFSSQNSQNQSPLFLTPLIETHQTEKARKLAVVNNNEFLAKGLKSYSGYLTVNQSCNSNLFIWYFPAKINPSNAPVVLFLAGGPGMSFFYPFFMETGPFFINSKNKLEPRKYTWHEKHNMLYIDNPVGTGFSFADLACYMTNQEDIGNSLFIALRQFFQLFSELRNNKFFIYGESYASKYILALVNRIIAKRFSPDTKDRINLKGIAYNDGIVDPINQQNYGDFLFQAGFIDSNALVIFNETQNAANAAILAGNNLLGLFYMTQIVNWNDCLFYNLSGFTAFHHTLRKDGYSVELNAVTAYMASTKLMRDLHLGNRTFVSLNNNGDVLNNLLNDIMNSVAHWLEEAINNYKVVVISGFLDLLAGPTLTANYLSKLNHNDAPLYEVAPSNIYRVGGDLAGTYKIAGNLTEVRVRDAGHFVIADQQKWALDILLRLTTGTGF